MGDLFEVRPTEVACAAIIHNFTDIVLLQALQVVGLLFVLFRATLKDDDDDDDAEPDRNRNQNQNQHDNRPAEPPKDV